jgi:hypothetical protein
MQAYRFEAVVPENGELRLKQIPFRPGEIVEIIVLSRAPLQGVKFPLKNTVLKFENPTEPVASQDWGVLQ